MSKKNKISFSIFLIIIILLLSKEDLFAKDMKITGYREPEKNIVNIIDTPNTPQMSVSPAGNMALMVEYTSMLTLEDLAEEIGLNPTYLSKNINQI